MGVFSGPDISESGLIFAVDGGNTKSFKGEVTTNVVPDAALMSSWSAYSNGNDGTFITEFGTTGYRMINRGSWNGLYRGVTLPSTGTYTVSAWFRYWGGAADNNGASVYTSGGGISDTAVYLDKSLVGVWQRVSMTRTYSSTSLTFYLISFGGTYGGSNSTWDVTMPQIEQKSYTTNFVSGTRGSTVDTGGGWADLSGNLNHGTLVNGVRESSDNLGALVFDGANDFVLSSSIATYGNNTTWEAWIYSTANVSSYNMFMGRYLPYFGFYTGNSFIFSNLIGGAQCTIYTPTNLALNTWYHATFTTSYNGTNTTMRTYVNGVETASGVFTGTQGNYSLNFMVGDGNNSGNNSWYPFQGRISNVKVYNRTLTASEVQQNFNANRSRYGI